MTGFALAEGSVVVEHVYFDGFLLRLQTAEMDCRHHRGLSTALISL
jgi:hypothetical protein